MNDLLNTWAQDAYSLKLITGPTVYVASASEVMAWGRITDATETDVITDKIKSATGMIEHHSNRILCSQTFELRMPCFPGVAGVSWATAGVAISGSGLRLPCGPWQSITSVKYYATDGTLTTLASTQYLFDDATGWLTPIYGGIWPIAQYRTTGVQVRFLAGFGPLATDVPSLYKDCVIMTVLDWLENRHGRFELPNGVKEKLDALNPCTVLI